MTTLFTDDYGQPLNQQIDINDLDPNYCSYYNTDPTTSSNEYCTGDGEWPVINRPCYGCMVYRSLPKAEIGGVGYTLELATTDLEGIPYNVNGGIGAIIITYNESHPYTITYNTTETTVLTDKGDKACFIYNEDLGEWVKLNE